MGTDRTDNQNDGGEAELTTGVSETPQSYTKEQVDKIVRDTRTAVLADTGRLKAEAEKALKAAKDASERLSRLQKEQEEAELRTAEEDPDALSVIRIKQEARRLKAELEAKETELNAVKSQMSEFANKEREATKLTIAQEVASDFRVDTGLLTKLAKFTNGSREDIEAIAKDLPRANQVKTLTPDSNRSRGGSPQGKSEIQKDYIAGKINAVLYTEKLKALGLVP